MTSPPVWTLICPRGGDASCSQIHLGAVQGAGTARDSIHLTTWGGIIFELYFVQPTLSFVKDANTSILIIVPIREKKRRKNKWLTHWVKTEKKVFLHTGICAGCSFLWEKKARNVRKTQKNCIWFSFGATGAWQPVPVKVHHLKLHEKKNAQSYLKWRETRKKFSEQVQSAGFFYLFFSGAKESDFQTAQPFILSELKIRTAWILLVQHRSV